MATGLPLLGHQPPGPLRVWLWNGEEPVEELGRRMAAAMKNFGIAPEMVGDRLFIDNGHTMPLVLAEESRDGTRVHAPLVHGLIGELRRREVDAFLVDPVISTRAGPRILNRAISGRPASQTDPKGSARSRTSEQKTTA